MKELTSKKRNANVATKKRSKKKKIGCNDQIMEKSKLDETLDFVENNLQNTSSLVDEEDFEETNETSCRPWRLGIDVLDKDEELQFDRDAYKMLHRLTPPWSMYSFDIVPDSFGQMRLVFPHTMYIVSGTQNESQTSENINAINRLYIMKFSQLDSVVDYDYDSWEAETIDSGPSKTDLAETPKEPDIKSFFVEHRGFVNKVAICPQLKRLVGSWSSTGHVHMWDIKQHLEALDVSGPIPKSNIKPKQTFDGHTKEGYALTFNPHLTGQAASGGCDGVLYLWTPIENGWDVTRKIKTHQNSIEDVQWKQEINAQNILATCSIDTDVHFIDLRSAENPILKIHRSHDSDVNTLRWSHFKHNMLLTGSDDCSFKVWDIRNLTKAVFELCWHKKPISAIDWHPTDSEVFAIASYDDSVTIWDMSIIAESSNLDFPDQLLFQHMGQHHISEIRWHPQIPGVMLTTAEDGFNVFQTQNI